MESHSYFTLFADLLLVLHVIVVAFIVLGPGAVFLGKLLGWRWILNPWFRSIHLGAIGVVVLQVWLGIICPLTTWEMQWRAKAAETIYEGSFVKHWLSKLLYYQAPSWAFVLCYTVFGGLVLLSWVLVKPNSFSQRDKSAPPNNGVSDGPKHPLRE